MKVNPPYYQIDYMGIFETVTNSPKISLACLQGEAVCRSLRMLFFGENGDVTLDVPDDSQWILSGEWAEA